MADEDLLKRVPPHNIEAEMACLGAMLSSSQAVDIVMEIISAESFYDEKNKLIFSVITGLKESSSPIDAVTVSDKLESSRNLDKAGGAAYLAKLTESVPAFSNVGYYAKIIREKAILRGLLYTSMEIADNVYQYESDIDYVLKKTESDILTLTSAKDEFGVYHINELSNQYIRSLDKMNTDKIPHKVMPTGYKQLDDMLNGGFEGGEFNILAARPSMGKTALSLNIAARMTKSGAGVLMFSLEMTNQEIIRRLLSLVTGIEHKKLRSGILNQSEWENIVEHYSEFKGSKFYICDQVGMTDKEIIRISEKYHKKHGISHVIIDHLGLINSDYRGNLADVIGEITRGLKAMAKRLNISVLCLCQLKRIDDRQDKKPTLSDLRDSGKIEQDADKVIGMYRAAYYNNTTSGSGTEIIVLKHRDGQTGTIYLDDHLSTMQFKGMEEIGEVIY